MAVGQLGAVPELGSLRLLTAERGGILSPSERRRAVDPLGEPLARALDGDEDAFSEVWRLLHPPLLRYLRVRDRDTAEDIAAETWLHVVRDLRRFTGGPAEFRAWVFTLGRHRAIDAGRARAARPSTPTAEVIDIGTAPSAEAAALERADTDAAVRLVATLPAAQAEMVMLRIVAGLSVAEVAAIVGKKPGTVAVNVHRALKKLAHSQQARAARG
ncbi:RNA polymerase sigma factor [Nocardioides humi]|uniref:RNA polymerase sigma factor n=1 Tax=Nocardioides humi TaxID=449461 RepID=A0ABN2AP50_9ACTN|nr:sigma-70 family RNA polymerase sigma factor [Nocardioides humi]